MQTELRNGMMNNYLKTNSKKEITKQDIIEQQFNIGPVNIYKNVRQRLQKHPELLWKFNKLKAEEFALLWKFSCDFINDEHNTLEKMDSLVKKAQYVKGIDRRLEDDFISQFPGNSISYYYDLISAFIDIYQGRKIFK